MKINWISIKKEYQAKSNTKEAKTQKDVKQISTINDTLEISSCGHATFKHKELRLGPTFTSKEPWILFNPSIQNLNEYEFILNVWIMYK